VALFLFIGVERIPEKKQNKTEPNVKKSIRHTAESRESSTLIAAADVVISLAQCSLLPPAQLMFDVSLKSERPELR
jgi:hypothetical protein